MAFPSVQTRNTSAVTTGSTSHTVSLPSGISAGDLLFAAFGYGVTSNTISWPSGWTKLGTDREETTGETQGMSLGYRKADGTEGASITVTSSTSCKSAHCTLRISGAAGPATQVPEDAKANGTATDNPDPPNLVPTGGAKDYLWIAVGTSANGAASYSASTNYSNLQQVDTAGTASSDCATCTEERSLNASSEDPGVITRGASQTRDWCAATVAIHPGAATITGSLSKTLGVATLAAVGLVQVSGQLSKTLGPATPASSGAVAVVGSLSKSLGTATSSSAGSVAVVGSETTVLGAASVSSTGTVADPSITGDLSITLGTASISSVGAVTVQASLTKTAGAATVNGTGSGLVSGTLHQSLGVETLSSTGALSIVGSLIKTLDASTVSATGGAGAPPGGEISGNLTQTHGACTVASLASRAPFVIRPA